MPFGLYGPAPRTLEDLVAWIDKDPERRLQLVGWLLKRLRDPERHDELLTALVVASMIHNAHLGDLWQGLIDAVKARTHREGEEPRAYPSSSRGKTIPIKAPPPKEQA